MNENLIHNIKRKLTENSLSISALERVAGLKQSAVQNILNGRSKRPSMAIVQAVADSLGCSVSELLGESAPRLHLVPQHDSSLHLHSINLRKDPERETFMEQDWDLDYYMKCVALIHDLLDEKHISKDNFDRIVEEVYYYSHRDGLTEPDRRYAKRLLETMT